MKRFNIAFILMILLAMSIFAGCSIMKNSPEPITGSKTNTVFTQSFSAPAKDGVKTSFQSASEYNAAIHIPAESVMVYASDPSSIDSCFSSWQKSGYELDVMLAINRTTRALYLARYPDGEKDYQRRADGSVITHAGGDEVPYMVPTKRFVEFTWTLIKACLKYKPAYITLEEPEMWHESGYSEGFKEEWRDYYGEDWQDPASSPEAQLKSEKLKTHLFEYAISELSKRIKAASPDTKLYLATHSTPNYSNYGITAGLNAYAALDGVDGIIGQAWSDTSLSAIPYEGGPEQLFFNSAYIEYASLAASVKGKTFFALADPKADNAAYSWEEYQSWWEMSVVSSLMVPSIGRFEVLPWPDRSFSAAPSAYKTVQQNVFNALEKIGAEDGYLYAGTPGIYVGLSDSLSWQYGDYNGGRNSDAGFYGITAPLVEKGIPIGFTPLEQLKSADDLKDVKILILSYDIQKPLSEQVNTAIADWVKQGGTLLYLGGRDTFSDLSSQWWSKDGTPLANLFSKLGLNIKMTYPNVDKYTEIDWAGEAGSGAASDSVIYKNADGDFNAAFKGSGFDTFMTAKGNSIGISAKAGNGKVLCVGMSSDIYSAQFGGPDLLCSIVKYAAGKAGIKYGETNLVSCRRGKYIAAYAIAKDEVIKGRFIDLYDKDLSIVTNKTVKAGTAALLYDIGEEKTGSPELLYTGGILSGEVSATADKTIFTLKGADDSISATLLSGNGKYPKTVTALRSSGKADLITRWDNATGSLLLLLRNTTEPCKVTVEWSTEPRKDDPKLCFDDFYVPTNATNADLDYLVRSTAGVNDSLRFADGDSEIVYKIDLSKYINPIVTLDIVQNYIVEVSDHDGDYKKIADYSEINPEHLTTGTNRTTLAIDPSKYGIKNTLYFRITNTDKTMGWGGSIYGFRVSYKKLEE